MTLIRVLIIGCLLALVHAEEGQIPDRQHAVRAVLSDGRTLAGTLGEGTEPGSFLFLQGGTANPEPISSSDLSRIQFLRPVGQGGLWETASVHLLNGDTFRGRILKLDGETLELDTPYAGNLTLRRSAVGSLVWGLEAGVEFQGPRSLEEWTLYSTIPVRDGWNYENGALFTSAKSMQTAGLELPEFPDRARITFQLQWKEKLQLETSFWADNAGKSREHHTLILQEGMFRLKRRTKRGHTHVGTVNPSGIESRGKAKVCLLLNREEKKIHLFLDDVLLTTFTDTYVAEPAMGNALIFRGNPLGITLIHDLEIRDWDGKVEAVAAKDEPAESDQLYLTNGDILSGAIEEMKAETVAFRMGDTRIPIPRERVTQILFQEKKIAGAKPEEGMAAVYLNSDDRLTLADLQVKDGALSGVSPFAGKLTLDLKQLQEISFQPNPSGKREDRLPKSWLK